MKATDLLGRQEANLVPKPVPNVNEILVRSSIQQSTQQWTPFSTGHGRAFFTSSNHPCSSWVAFLGNRRKIGDKVSDFQIGDQILGNLQYDPSTKEGTFSDYITDRSSRRPRCQAKGYQPCCRCCSYHRRYDRSESDERSRRTLQGQVHGSFHRKEAGS